MDSSSKNVGMIIGYIRIVLSAIISFVYIPLLLSTIGQNEYGLYQILGSIIAYFSTITSSLNSAVMRYYTMYLSENDKYNMENTLAICRRIFLMISVLFLIVSIPVSLIYRYAYRNSLTEHELEESMILFLILVVNIIIYLNNTIYSAPILSNERFLFQQSLDLVAEILQPCFIIAAVLLHPYALSIALAQLVVNIIKYLANWSYAIKRINVKIIYHKENMLLIKGVLSLSGSVLFAAIADQIFWKIDQLILGQQYGTGTVAVYSIGSQINAIFIRCGCILSSVLWPTLDRIIHVNKDKEELNGLFNKTGRIQSFILMFIVSGFMLYGKEFVYIISGTGYKESYYVSLLLMIPYTIDLLQNSGIVILQIGDKYWFRAKALFIAAIINIFLTYFLSLRYGMTGAAFATAVATVIVSGFIMNIYYSKVIGLDIKGFWSNVLPIWIKGSIPFGIGWLILRISCTSLFLQFVVHGLLYIMIYTFFVFFFCLNIQERTTIKSKISKLRSYNR